MNTQPEALRLADALLKAPGSGHVTRYCDDAAAELRRLQAENEVLKGLRDGLMAVAERASSEPCIDDDECGCCIPCIARAAIASVKDAA